MADLRIVDAPVLLQESITDDVKMPTGGLGNYAIRLGDLVWYVVAKENLASKSYVDTSSKGVQDKLDAHIANKNNPHDVTKEQVGLGNVDNTADVDKPVSNAVSSAITTATNDMATKAYVNQKDNLKADKATTLSGYGITDAYTKVEIDTKEGDLTTLTTTDKTNLVKAINEVHNNTSGLVTLYDKNNVVGAGVSGWDSNLVTYGEATQKQINDGLESIAQLLSIKNPRAGMRVYVKSYYAGLNKGGGEFVYDESNTSIYDGGVSFGKWRRQFVTLTPQHFGVIGNFSDKTLADFYSKLSDAQTIFSTAVALDELHDRVAFATYLKYLIANQVRTNWTAQILLDKPLPSYTTAKTLLIDGALTLKSYKTNLKYCLHIATDYLVLTGSVVIAGTASNNNDMRTRYIEHGVVCGADTKLGLAGSAQNCDFGTIIGSNILGFALAYLANCHFSTTRQVRGSNAGSSGAHSTKYLQGFVDSFTLVSSSGGDTGQRSLLQVTDVALFDRITQFNDLRVIIGGLPYDVMAVDSVNKQVTIYPQLPPSITSGNLLYIFGGAALITSNNTACTSIGVCEAILCGYGLHAPALYGVSINSFTTEYCGIGISLSTRGNVHIGTILQLGYFEANKVDILYGWTVSSDSWLTILQSIALNPKKIFSMYAYTEGETRRSDWAYMNPGNLVVGNGSTLAQERSVWEIHSQHYSNNYVVGGSQSITLSYDRKIAELTKRNTKVVTLTPLTTASTVTLSAPTGYTVNGGASVVINMGDYNGIVSVALYVPISATATDITVVVSGNKKALSNLVTYDPPSLATATQQSTTVTLSGAKLGDTVAVSFNKALNGTRMWGEVTAADTVTVYHRNDTGAAVDIASGTLTVKIV